MNKTIKPTSYYKEIFYYYATKKETGSILPLQNDYEPTIFYSLSLKHDRPFDIIFKTSLWIYHFYKYYVFPSKENIIEMAYYIIEHDL